MKFDTGKEIQNNLKENSRKKNNNSLNKTKLDGIDKKTLFFSAIIIIIICCYVLNSIIDFIKNPTNTVFVKEGIIEKEETNIGYIIRDEVVVKGDNYKNGMEQIVDEGQKVAKDESIFRYYSNGEDDLKNKIVELDNEIEKIVAESNEDLFSSDTKMLDSQISERLYKLNDLNDIQKIQENKKAIDSFLVKKSEIAGELSPKGSHLKELINQRNEYQSSLSNDSEYISSPKSGILSYRIDGLEETLTIGDFSKYNKDFLSGLNIKTGQIISTNIEQGKVVSNFECYIACTSKSEEAKKAKVGDKVKIILPSTRQVPAKINYVINENDEETTLFLQFENGIDELLNYRKITFDIVWWDEKGFKIPNSTIITQNDLNYVIKNKKGILERVLVKLIKQSDNYSIVENYSASELQELNIDKNIKTSLLLNDELLLNPTKDQIDSTN